jgi:hypothetical protein
MTELTHGMTEMEVYRTIIQGVRRFTGHQVISFDAAWKLCTDLEPDDRELEEARRLRWLLEELGYERRWVTEFGRTKMTHLWVREPWQHDFVANLTKPITVYIPAG